MSPADVRARLNALIADAATAVQQCVAACGGHLLPTVDRLPALADAARALAEAYALANPAGDAPDG